jgi:hypothetical protein
MLGNLLPVTMTKASGGRKRKANPAASRILIALEEILSTGSLAPERQNNATTLLD